MSEQMNYMQRVGHSKCVRCDFETSDDMTFEQQDAAMMAHLADRHPNWMAEQVTAEPSPEPDAAPTSEAQAPAAPDSEIRKCIKNTFGTFFITGGRQYRYNESDRVALVELLKPLEAELAQLRARVAILDAQEVELPELPKPLRNSKFWDEGIEWRIAGERAARLERERQLLDALRAVQAWREVAGNYRAEHEEWVCVTSGNEICSACKSYDTLAGKGE